MGRRLLGVFMTVYMPTILMNIIGHSTNYIKPLYFEAVISVNLTVMLVLTTMFVSVSNDLPRTSYLKMVDIWMVFNLLIPFVEVLLHVYMVSFALIELTTFQDKWQEDESECGKFTVKVMPIEMDKNKDNNKPSSETKAQVKPSIINVTSLFRVTAGSCRRPTLLPKFSTQLSLPALLLFIGL